MNVARGIALAPIPRQVVATGGKGKGFLP